MRVAVFHAESGLDSEEADDDASSKQSASSLSQHSDVHGSELSQEQLMALLNDYSQ